MIDKGTHRHELADRQPWNVYYFEAACRRIEHPIRNLIGTPVRLPNREMVNAVMLVVANHENGLADHGMKRIRNYGFECQKPGTMARLGRRREAGFPKKSLALPKRFESDS
jgi:hypothetical protein